MLIRPNRTVVRGVIRHAVAEGDGPGAQLTLEVMANESPSREDDAIRPETGAIIAVFWGRPEHPPIGEPVRARLKLLAGPFGQRVVVEGIERVEATP